ncbi:MAG: DNA polymerase I [Luteitalea sp.]|nr:DNA polymerase I [Luteitalea sp.]
MILGVRCQGSGVSRDQGRGIRSRETALRLASLAEGGRQASRMGFSAATAGVSLWVSMPERPVLFLIDGSSQMYRAYHAIRGLTGPDGRSTNAVYGFVTMLRKLVQDHTPAFIGAAFDLAGPTFRSELAADYKANRAPMPPDLAEQVPWVHEACAALGVPIITCERYEADDVMATLARRAVGQGFDVVLVTGDKDFFQLVDEHVRVFNPRDEGTWYDRPGVVEKFGVPPDRVVDVVALMGDAIDNIKGVPGIGEKGARELIAQHGSLDALLAHAAEVPQKRYREALATHRDQALQSRDLARIHADVPVDVDLDDLRYGGPSQLAAFELFSRLGFRSLVSEYAPSATEVERDYRIVTSLDEVRALAAELDCAGRFALYVAGDGPAPMPGTLVGMAVSTGPRWARYIPFGHTTLEATSNVDVAAALGVLKPVLEDPKTAKVVHDVKTAAVLLERHGIVLQGPQDDPMLASYVLDATQSSHAIEPLALERLGYRATAVEDVCGRGAKAIPLARVPVDATVVFAGERADLALQLRDTLVPALEREGLTSVYRELELPLVAVLVDIESAGVRLDITVLRGLSARLEEELQRRTARIYELAGVAFNINSPRQLAEVLFDKMQLPALKRTGKTRAASTAVEVLEELALVHELPREILEWRAVQKLKGTYVDALPQLIHRDTSRIHTSFNQAVAATGRLSSSEPNLQNIPIRTELGREIRRAFIAEPGNVIISADYSQIELRVLAHLANENALIDAFRRGEDIHDRTALQVFGADSGLSKHELRRRAKIINYALLYGKTAFTLARDIGVPQQAAQEFIDAYFRGFPSVRRFLDDTLARARDTGIVTTMFGRRRLVPEITSRNGQIRAAAERVAANLPIQGSAADILKRAMINLHAALAERPARDGRWPCMILTVHDELVFEARREEADEIAALVRHHMEGAVALTVPLTVDVGIGENWKEAKG